MYIHRLLGLSILGMVAAACSSNTQTQAQPSAAGGAAFGGDANSSGGGAAPQGGATAQTNAPQSGGANAQGSSSAGGSSAQGGSSTGGSKAQGGSSTGGATATGGSSTAGGATSTAGGASSQGGSSVGGATSTGGASHQGGSSSGGASTGGSSNGGASTGGSVATGGGGVVGGSPTGGAATGGNGSTSDTDAFIPVPNSQNTTNFDSAAWYKTWKGKFYKDCGSNGQARVADGVDSSQTFSEGIGYGMLLAVAHDDREAVDKLWAYYKAHLDPNGLMNWKINGCTSEAWGEYAATDGDEDVAMALVQADAKWGGYSNDAKDLIAKIKQFETSSTTNPTYLRPGDAANNGGRGEGVVNPSYFAPGYWRVWATYTNDPFWNQLTADAYAMLAKFQKLTISNYTNLVPDWGRSDGTNPDNGGYHYDACRTPWRVATDYVWFGSTEAKTFLGNISSFVDARGGITSVPFDKNSAFLGAFALSGMAVSQEKADTYLNAWLSASMDDDPYFQSSLRGLYLLVANNKFAKGM